MTNLNIYFAPKLYVLQLLFTSIFNPVNCQILNGDFEEWSVNNESIEYPLYWDAVRYDEPESVIKSNNAFTGLYSVKISTLNKVGHDYWPVHIGSKIKPLVYDYNLSINYLIDSIIDLSNGVIEVWQRDNNGDYFIITTKKLDKITESYEYDQVNFHLNSLDTLLIVIGAVNKETPSGFDGFISIFFDQIQLNEIQTGVSSLTNKCFPYYEISSGILHLNSECPYTNYRIYNISGILLQDSIIKNMQAKIEFEGLILLQLYNALGEFEVIKIFKVI